METTRDGVQTHHVSMVITKSLMDNYELLMYCLPNFSCHPM